ncbi:MAG TPA: MFS transporter [Mycobacteriales bacterium]|nr:MFS transporter [Mycobacteriales bacterium]
MTAAPPSAPAPRVRYRDVLADREYRSLFAADGLSVVGDQVTRIAVALLVLERTGSALAASATYAASYLSWLLGGPVLSSLADRLPRRRVLLACDLARAGLVALLAVPGLPLPLLFLLLTVVGLLAPPFDAARSALLADVLDGERYVVGSALSSGVANVGQLLGFLAGGALVALLGTSGALLVDAGTFLLSAALVAAGVRARPAPRGEEPLGRLRAELVAGVRLVRGAPVLRGLLGWAVLSAGVVAPAEALAVVLARDAGGGPLAGGVLTAAVPAGYVLGVWAVLRLPAERRRALFPALTAVSAVFLCLTPLVGSLPLLVALWVVAGTGTALHLVANAAFVQAVPPHLRGRAFGVAGTALTASQGLVMLVAGGLAEVAGAAAAVASVSACALLVLLCVVLRPRSALQEAVAPAEALGR